MKDNKCEALTGVSNKRLNNIDLRNNQYTFPLADVETTTQNAHLTIPSEEDVIHAKKWVDNGSRL
ncbi:MAG: DUF3787 domain-containing protein [Cellulosilyticum sp.]|nr:DUF3787 domain-containing protein [Cellulosilyticum sp.]